MNQINPTDNKIEKGCLYCTNPYFEDNNEHVFPEGLGGAKVYIDCVCSKCNSSFSGLETELLKNSPVAFIRNAKGVSKFNAPLHLMFDEKHQLVFEVSQIEGFQIYVRPQLMFFDGRYRVYGNEKNAKEFSKICKEWFTTNLRIVTEYVNIENKVSYVEFRKESDHYTIIKNSDQFIVKDEITIQLLDETNKLYPYLTPRLYLDDRNPEKKRLRIRAKTQDEAINFIKNYLDLEFTNKNANETVENQYIFYKDPEIYVGLSHNQSKLERAVVKIGLNCLMHYFPMSKKGSLLDPYTTYVKTGFKSFNVLSEEKCQIKDSLQETHNIFFYQSNSFVNIRLSLFNGFVVYNFSILHLSIMPTNEYSRLVIDYKRKINRFENINQFLTSFDKI